MAARKPLLSSANTKTRLTFAREHKEWTVPEWNNVLWSDKSSFEIFNSKNRVFVRRRPGERYSQECLAPTVKFGGGKLMVWGCFSGRGMGTLHRIEGTMNQNSYQEVLRTSLLPSIDKLYGPNDTGECLFQQDNAPCHKAASVLAFLQRRNISTMQWPPQSPDFNPIENLWNILKKEVSLKKPENINSLWEVIHKAWNNVSEQQIAALVGSMPERMKLAISAKGGATRY